MFIILIVVRVSRVYSYVKTNQIIYFKYVQFSILQIYINKAVKWQNNKMINTCFLFKRIYLFSNYLISVNEEDTIKIYPFYQGSEWDEEARKKKQLWYNAMVPMYEKLYRK